MVREATTSMVYVFIRDGPTFERDIDLLAVFVHILGKRARQGEVMVEFRGEVPGRGFESRAYFVDDYSKAGERPF